MGSPDITRKNLALKKAGWQNMLFSQQLTGLPYSFPLITVKLTLYTIIHDFVKFASNLVNQ